MKKYIKELIDTLQMIWNKLPKEVKVSLFITMSYTISEIISNLEGI